MKVLVIGYGAIGRRHVKNLLENTNLEIIIYTKRDDLDSLKRKKLVNCIYCGSTFVKKAIMAPNLYKKSNK